MQYKQNQKIIIDRRKLDILIRLGCPDIQILELIKTGDFTRTGDSLIDETLECLIDIKDFDNWGGKREGAGRKPKNQLEFQDENQDENQLDNQDGNQDAIQVVDKDIDKEKYKEIKERDIKGKPLKEKKNIRPSLEEVIGYCKERNNKVNPNKWYDYYESNGWKVGRNPMKDWKASVRLWEHNNFGQQEENEDENLTADEWLDKYVYKGAKHD